jgi:predicted phage baseplate assembly protein
MACVCDTHDCGLLIVPAGLAALPRAIGTFADWRRDLLEAIGRDPLLDAWRAREPGDLGVMLVEFFAYMADVTSFYDALTANAAYLGTASDAGGTRRLVALLGYRPRPAYGASVWLAAEADGVRTIALPRGTAFRSGAFPGSAPQLFELSADAIIEPRVNRLPVDRVPATTLPVPLPGISVTASSVRVQAGQAVVLASGDGLVPARIAAARLLSLRIRRSVTQLDFTSPIVPPAGATYASSRLLRGGARCGAWKGSVASGESPVVQNDKLSLDARVAIQPGEIILVEAKSGMVARRVVSIEETQYVVQTSLTSTITDSANKQSTLVSPAIKAATTRILVDAIMPFTDADIPTLVVHYAMSDAATLHAPLKDTLAITDPVVVPKLIDAPRAPVTNLALEDAHGEGVVTAGSLDAATHSATVADSPAWGLELMQPVLLFGNVFAATRGETVASERLGAGDASLPLQTFRLKKKPLTYLAAANAAGRVSTLAIWVGGVQWHEVESFYGQAEDAQVFVVRHDEEGETDVDFGGGARLPTGAEVIASYRFGAGAAAPPADSVKQLAHPVAGLRSVRNVLPAYGGADAEAADAIAIYGPASALLLGRAISLVDLEAAALQQTGVQAARAAWRWDELGQRPAVLLRYIGDPQLAPAIRAALRALTEEDAPIAVESAPAEWAKLDVALDVDAGHVADTVADAVGTALFAAVTLPGTGGLLRPERLGPDGSVFASHVVRAIMEVEGVSALKSLTFNEAAFAEVARTPAAGAYFDFADGGVRINGRLAG